jgi:magnesium-transporting ATPase (P-type)
MKIPLTVENLLLRGSSLRNTDFVYGVAVFTGHDSKVMRNNEKAKYKFSTLEKLTNQSIFVILGTQVILSIIGSLFGSTWTQLNSEFMGTTPECQDPDNTMDWCHYERVYYLFMDKGKITESGFPFG